MSFNAQYIRNLILINHGLHDHTVRFYHLSALDWVDVLQIPKADPAKTAALAESISPWTRNSRNEMRVAQDKVKGVAASGQLGLFTNGYWGHPQMRLSPDVNLVAFAHYLQALEFQRKSNQVVGISLARHRTSRISRLEELRTRSTWTAKPHSGWSALSQ